MEQEKKADAPELFGMKVVIDPSIPPDTVRVVSGKNTVTLTNLAAPAVDTAARPAWIAFMRDGSHIEINTNRPSVEFLATEEQWHVAPIPPMSANLAFDINTQLAKFCVARLDSIAAPAVDAAKLDDLGKLKALAEAATPGEWYVHPITDDDLYPRGLAITAANGKTISDEDTGPGNADAEFMAAANPAAILRIAALVAQQAARIAELEARDWISVDERLPEDGQLVAALYWPYDNKENAQAVTGGRLHDGTFYNDEDDECHPPSHWLLLPAIPTATQEGK